MIVHGDVMGYKNTVITQRLPGVHPVVKGQVIVPRGRIESNHSQSRRGSHQIKGQRERRQNESRGRTQPGECGTP